MGIVENLSEAVGSVALVFEKLGEGGGVRERVPEVGFVIVGFG